VFYAMCSSATRQSLQDTDPPASRMRHGSALPLRSLCAQAAALPILPLVPAALSCSIGSLLAPGQVWIATPAPSPAGAFTLQLAPESGPIAGLCLLHNGSVVHVDACTVGGALWQWTASGGLQAVDTAVGRAGAPQCLFMESRLSLSQCSPGAPYNTLVQLPTGQLAMNFTGSGALGDYTGYPQCVDAFASTHAELWASALANGDVLLLALNPTPLDSVDVDANMTAVAAALGLPRINGAKALRDCGARENLPLPGAVVFNISAVPPHGARLLRFTPT
jgi:hypothetical protein